MYDVYPQSIVWILINLLGVNMETEVMYYYKRDPLKKVVIDKEATPILDGYKVVNGIVYETEKTPQPNCKNENGTMGTRSGNELNYY
jgi:hypothetical protein